jgi:hypothetical protein
MHIPVYALVLVPALVLIVILAYFGAKRRRPAKKPLRLPELTDRATARVIDGYVTLVGIAAAPTDRFQLEDARPPAGRDPLGPVWVQVRRRGDPESNTVTHIVEPGVGGVVGPAILGAEHEVIVTPEGSTLIGRIV